MDLMRNESGFTFFEMLLILSIIIITLPFITFLLQKMNDNGHQDHISVQQFFNFVQKDAEKAEEVYHENNRLFFVLNPYETAAIERYDNVIRRNVNGKGHEIYLRGIQSIDIEPVDFGFHLTVTTAKGEPYEKTIVTRR